MRQFKRIVENSHRNSVQENIARSQKMSGQEVEQLRERGRITQKKAAQFTRAFNESVSQEHTPSNSELQLTQILNKQIQTSQQLAEANQKLVQDAIERENQYLAFLEKTFDQVELQKQPKDSELAEDKIESKKSIQNLMIQSLERITEFEKIRLNLVQVLYNTRLAQSPIQLDVLTRSHSIRRWVLNPQGARSTRLAPQSQNCLSEWGRNGE